MSQWFAKLAQYHVASEKLIMHLLHVVILSVKTMNIIFVLFFFSQCM